MPLIRRVTDEIVRWVRGVDRAARHMAANVFGLPPGEQHERWLAEVAPSFREGKAASMVVDGTLFSRRG